MTLSDVREEFVTTPGPVGIGAGPGAALTPVRRRRGLRGRLAALAPDNDREKTLLLGLLLLAVGFYFAWPPGTVLVPGAILTLISLLPGGDR